MTINSLPELVGVGLFFLSALVSFFGCGLVFFFGCEFGVVSLAHVVLQPEACALTTTPSLSFQELKFFSLLTFDGGLQAAR